MRKLLAPCSLVLVLGCSHTIPPPVMTVATKPDEETATANPANADPNLRPPFGPYDIQTAFYISKSNDRDRVDYGLRLDQHCVPLDDDAMFPYWRELEHAPPVRSHPISFFQYVGYGLSEQKLVKRSDTGSQYRVTLRQVDRPVTVLTYKDAERHCATVAFARVRGIPNAKLDHIFVKVDGPMSVDYIEIYGTDPKTGAALMEHLKR